LAKQPPSRLWEGAGGIHAPEIPLNEKRLLEHFSNTRAVLSGVQGGFFLRKKPLDILLSLYTNWKNALVLQL
jgi:hypothetical protein